MNPLNAYFVTGVLVYLVQPKMQIKALLCLATAASALQLPFYAPDAGDRKLSGASRIGKSDGGVHATTNWEFTDCGSSKDACNVLYLELNVFAGMNRQPF